MPRTASPHTARLINDRAAFDLLLEHGSLSRAELQQRTGLSRATIGDLVDRLEAGNLITPVGESPARRRGPNAVLYGVVADRAHVAGVEVRAGEVLASVNDLTGNQVGSARRPLDPAAEPDQLVFDTITDALLDAQLEPGRLDGVVVGTPGLIDPETGDVSYVGALPTWHDNLLPGLRARLGGLPVLVENEVNLVGLAEHRLGAAQGETTFALLSLGTGVGMAVILNGRLHRGRSGGAGEISYLPLGLTGSTFPDLIAGPALLALAHSHGLTPPTGTSTPPTGTSTPPTSTPTPATGTPTPAEVPPTPHEATPNPPGGTGPTLAQPGGAGPTLAQPGGAGATAARPGGAEPTPAPLGGAEPTAAQPGGTGARPAQPGGAPTSPEVPGGTPTPSGATPASPERSSAPHTPGGAAAPLGASDHTSGVSAAVPGAFDRNPRTPSPDAPQARGLAGGRLGAEELGEVVRQAPPAFLDELADRIVFGARAVCAVLDPGVLILAGTIGRAGGEDLAARVEERLAALIPLPTRVVPGTVEGDPVLRGAVVVALERLYTQMFDQQ
ncbi:ROK family protein [Nonomuraea sp. NPDC050547]|uniref:ROK family transcriptional regulator n=1 Tax=Nonomuraea sp. NPDC050547 TaxID=3364368 RepID=UPI0037B219E1